MTKNNQPTILVPDQRKLEHLIRILQEARGGPLMIKEVAARMGISLNTASKYVDVAEAATLVWTDRYGSVRRVWLGRRNAEETLGGGS